MQLENGLELIRQKRGYGKSVRIIKESAKTGYRIIVPTEYQKEYIMQKAHDMGYDIPEPYTEHEIVGRRIALKERNVLVDNVEYFISKALDNYLGCHVVKATMSQEEEPNFDKLGTKYMF